MILFNCHECVCVYSKMFPSKNNATLVCSKSEYGKIFMFEATLHLAEQGNKVFYISPEPLKSFPATYHDRNITPVIFNMIKFLYLSNYEVLIKQLAELHTFASLPSVLVIEDLNHYITDTTIKEHKDVHIARLCALIQDTLNTCMRAKNSSIQFCTSTNLDTFDIPYFSYFNRVWLVNDKKEHNQVLIELSSIRLALNNLDNCDERRKIFRYRFFEDRTLILDKIVEK
ncbi:uncharacterized protein [Chelonus insularis]|uniref:uncharacterized protein n=1 Tax=Chelonus insularis TaxID=460826 RepID=UPI00158B296F|nr:uncharacterized protein LOC118070102 [Chelonus insularis]